MTQFIPALDHQTPHPQSRIRLRRASSEDRAFLISVYASTRHEEMEAWGWNSAQRQAFVQMQYEARTRTYTSAFPAAAESIIISEDLPIGSMSVHESQAELRLVDISILPQYRNRGIGTLLIANLISEANRVKLPLRLSVLHTNRAVHVYRRLGFMVTGGDDVYLEMEFAQAKTDENTSDASSQE